MHHFLMGLLACAAVAECVCLSVYCGLMLIIFGELSDFYGVHVSLRFVFEINANPPVNILKERFKV